MKRFGTVFLAICLAALPSFGSHAQPSPYSQMHFKRSRVSHRTKTRTTNQAQQRQPHVERTPPPPFAGAPRPSTPSRRAVRQGRFKNGVLSSSISTVSFIAGTRWSTTEEADDSTYPVLGDFNGDGKMDVAKIVYSSQTATGSIAIVLGNGDGTFQAAVLTDTPFNTDDPIVVGDVNGDGKDDIVQVHPVGDSCSRAQPARALPQFPCGSSIDVLISNGDGTFAAPVNYPVSGASLIGGLLTDVDGDGHLDVLAIDNVNPADVIVLTGAGDGTFSAPATPTTLTGAAPENLFFADFNGDGKLDIAGDVSGQIEVILASGSSFAAPVQLATVDAAYDSCYNLSGDLNGDGMPEIVSVNCDELNTVTIYVNNGDGTFKPGVYQNNAGNLEQWPNGAAIADMNGDGNNDIIISNEDGGDVSVLLGHGDGTVTAEPLCYGVGGAPWMPPLIADFNGDGLPDVLESDDYFNLVYLQGYGDGSLRGATIYSLPNTFESFSWSYSLAAGDFNGDGFPDVVLGAKHNDGSTGLVVYLGKGDGSIYPGVSYGESPTLAYVAVADFNGDGKLDIAATDVNNDNIQIFTGNGDGTFNVGLIYSTGGNAPQNLVTGDFNHDGNMDLAVPNGASGNIGVLLGNGDGTFAPAVTYDTTGYQPYQITAADINGDGYLDLAVTAYTDGNAAVGVFLANNDNTGTFHAVQYTVLNGGPYFAAFGDLDKDGKLDLAVTENEGSVYQGFVEIGKGNGDGTFGTLTAYPTSLDEVHGPDPADIQVVDINGDGNPDLVYINGDIGTVGVMYGNGDLTMNTPVEFPGNYENFGMALADLNGDGAVDVITANDYTGGFTVFLNGNGSGTAGNYTLGTTTPSQSVSAGGSANYMLDVVGINGYTGTITFACSNLPAGATCSFNPSSVAAKDGVPFTTTMTIQTTAAAAASFVLASRPGQSGGPVLLASFAGIGLLGLVLAGSGTKGHQRRTAIVLGFVLLATLGSTVACNNDNSTKITSTRTPAGAYAVTVTSTGTGTNAPTHSLLVILVVQ